MVRTALLETKMEVEEKKRLNCKYMPRESKQTCDNCDYPCAENTKNVVEENETK